MRLRRQLINSFQLLRRHRASLGLLLLLLAGYLGNLTRWTLFFNIDFVFGSIPVWIVMSLYGVGWGTVAGLIAGSCTYFLWGHPYAAIIFTCEALIVGWLFYRYRQNIVLLDGIFWLGVGMPLIWLFYSQVLRLDLVQAQIILLKQPVNGILNTLIANLLITHWPIHQWLHRPRAVNTLSFQQTLFNLLVAFVFLPTLLLIVLASRGVVETIKTTAQAELSQVSASVVAEVRSWYSQYLQGLNELARLVATESFASLDHLQRQLVLARRMLPDLVSLAVVSADKATVLASTNTTRNFAHLTNQPYIQISQTTLQPILSDPFRTNENLPPKVILNVPIIQNTNLLGFVVGEIALDRIEALLKNHTREQSVQITLVGRNHLLVVTTYPDRVMDQVFNLSQEGDITPLNDQTYQWFPKKGSQLVMARWMNSSFVRETAIAPGLPWTAIVEVSAKPDAHRIQSLYTRNLTIILAIAILALIFSVLISRQLVRPLAQLATMTTNLPDKLLTGEPLDWMNSQVTEIALLVCNFRTMANSLTQKFQEFQQALAYEALLKRITDKVRDSLDESQILQSAVQELGTGLDVECCNTDVYDLEHQTCLIRCEYTKTLPPIQGVVIPMASLPEVYQQLLKCQYFQFCMTIPNPARPDCKKTAILSCPIFDDQGVLGDLWVFKEKEEIFSDQEIRLVQQVANQCAIAIRQARLYQQAQIQVKALEELNHLKDDFLSTVSHELRTPIANMKMAIQMLKLSTDKEKQDRYLKILQMECDREADLINDLLDLQRLTAGTQALNLEPIHLQEWVSQIADSFQERIGSRQQVLQIEVSTELPIIISDPACLDRILTELLNNACKYTPPGERIKVSARTIRNEAETEKSPQNDVPFLSSPFSFVLDVCNSGVEIPPSELPNIFEKFYRVPGIDRWKQGGTGLGLALVQKMTQHLGGKIYVASTANQTCFTIELPIRLSLN